MEQTRVSTDGFPDPNDRAPTILIVDDEALIRVMISDYLQECGSRYWKVRPQMRPSSSSRRATSYRLGVQRRFDAREYGWLRSCPLDTCEPAWPSHYPYVWGRQKGIIRQEAMRG
jgi:hypothetical protein